jgi:3-oxoadipate enol-lactonase
MIKVDVDDIEVNYIESGSGNTLVLIHGLGSDHSIWEPILPLLSENYHVIAPDLRGHGQTSQPDGPFSIELFSKDIKTFLDIIGEEKTHLVGQSMGGVIVQETALQYPEIVSSLTLISTFAYADPRLQEIFKELLELTQKGGYHAFFERAIRLANTPKFLEQNMDFFEEQKILMGQKTNIKSLEASIKACQKVNLLNSIKQINKPTMIIAGKDDLFTPPYHSELIYKAIPNSKIKIMEEVGHNLPVEKYEETFIIIDDFLAKIR